MDLQTRPVVQTGGMALPLGQPGPMTDMERFMFECFGYIVIEDVLSPEEVQDTLEAAKRLHQGKLAGKLHQIGAGFEQEPALERLIDHPAFLPKVRALYNDRFVLQ